MKNPLVSVIIPTYNKKTYVVKAIDSVLNQTYKNIEIIVIDDGSTDGTDKMISGLSKKNSKFIFLRNETNLGFVKTLNKAISRAKGKYIARLDDDDIWIDSQKLEKQINFLESHPDYVLIGSGIIVIKEKDDSEITRFLFPEEDEDIRRTLLIENLFAHSAVVFLKSAFEKVGGYDEEFGFFADKDLWLKLGKVGKMHNLPEYGVCYLDKESFCEYNERNLKIRRNLKQNLYLRKKHKDSYQGYLKAVLFCWASYFYSFLPFRQQIKPILFKIRILLLGRPAYKIQIKSKNDNK